jgi:hypothetical protein
MTILELLQGKTPAKKVRILYRIIERLRLRHNEVGDNFRNGVITEAQWKAFLAIWEPRYQRVAHILNVIKENQGLFLEAKMTEIRTLKEEGKVLTTYDTDIDIETV